MASGTASELKGSVAIGQSGGPTVVINQSLVGVVEVLRDQGGGRKKIFGGLHGVKGFLNDQLIELQDMPQARLDRIAQTPSAALGSTRQKPDEAVCQRIFEHFAKHDIRYFFYIGGNDSAETCRIVNEVAKQAGYELRCFHVPKTIDNDLLHNDHTPGFGSAAKFVAQAFMGDNLDNRSLPGIKLNVIMGRGAGFLTASSILARQYEDDGPHLVYVPEVAFDMNRFIEDVKGVYGRLGRCLVAVSEGIRFADGQPVVTKMGEKTRVDDFGNPQLAGSGALGDYLVSALRSRLGEDARLRADTFGYLQRSFAGCVSAVDAEEARQVGRKAAEAALAGEAEGSVTIQRASSNPYRVEYRLMPLVDVAKKAREMDHKYLAGTSNIGESYKEYVAPLVGPLPVVELLRKG